MEYVPGTSLDKIWKTLTQEQKIASCQELKGYLLQLQKLKGTRIQAMSGRPITIGLRFPVQCGPFDTEKELNDWMAGPNLRSFDIFKDYARSSLRDDHEICVAHGNISPRNIMAGKVAAVLDWDRCGWYPEYWETARMLTENAGISDYYKHIHHLLPGKYVQELLALRFVLSLSNIL